MDVTNLRNLWQQNIQLIVLCVVCTGHLDTLHVTQRVHTVNGHDLCPKFALQLYQLLVLLLSQSGPDYCPSCQQSYQMFL